MTEAKKCKTQNCDNQKIGAESTNYWLKKYHDNNKTYEQHCNEIKFWIDQKIGKQNKILHKTVHLSLLNRLKITEF